MNKEVLNQMLKRQRKEKLMLKNQGHKVVFECPVKECKKEFAQFNSLQKHLRVHTGDRPYSCTYPGCGKSFTQISNLKRHTKIHTGEKPYQCGVCHKRFGTLSNLQQHEDVHKTKNGRKVFPCPMEGCTKSYFYRCSLNKHVFKSHGKDSKNMVITKQKVKEVKKVTRKTKKQQNKSRISMIKSLVEQRMQEYEKEQVKETPKLKTTHSVVNHRSCEHNHDHHEHHQDHFSYGQHCQNLFNIFDEPVKEETSADSYSTKNSTNTSFLYEEEIYQQPKNVCNNLTSLFDNDDQLLGSKRKFSNLFKLYDDDEYHVQPQMMKKIEDKPVFEKYLENVEDEELKSIENFLDEQEVVSQSTISESPIIPFKLETVAPTFQPYVYNFFPQKEGIPMSQFESCFAVLSLQQQMNNNLFQSNVQQNLF